MPWGDTRGPAALCSPEPSPQEPPAAGQRAALAQLKRRFGVPKGLRCCQQPWRIHATLAAVTAAMAMPAVPCQSYEGHQHGHTRVFARVPVPPRTSIHRGLAAAPAPSWCRTPRPSITASSGAMAAPRLPGWHCAGACRKRNLGSAQFPSWPNGMHKGRAVPAAADALSLPEPPAHEQPFGAGIFHSIPRHSDMLQCPGTAPAADTPEQPRVARPAQGKPAANSSGRAILRKGCVGPAPLRGS